MIPYALTMKRRPITLERTLAAAGLAALMLPALAHGQQPLVADRPDFTEGPTTVGPGAVQLEFGYTFGRDRDGGATTTAHSLGEPLLRLGLPAEWLELRVGVGLVARRTEMNGRGVEENGFEDLYLGVKLALSEQNGVIPALGILPQATFPTGGAVSDGQVLPRLNLVYSWDVTDAFSLSGGTQVNRAAGASDDAIAEWAQSLSGGIGLGDRHGLYGEWFAVFHDEPGGMQAEHYANTGLTWLLTDDVQWDIRVGAGLNDRAEDLFFGTGLSLRLRRPRG